MLRQKLKIKMFKGQRFVYRFVVLTGNIKSPTLEYQGMEPTFKWALTGKYKFAKKR